MSAVIAFQERLTKTKQEIQKVTADLEAAKKSKAEALAAGEDSKAINSNHQLKTFQDRLEDLTITKAALEGKLRFYKQNEPEGPKICEQVAARLSQLADIHAGRVAVVQQARQTITESFTKSAPIEAEINDLVAKHLQLTGEMLRIPDTTLLNRAYYDAQTHLTDKILDAPWPPWEYIPEKKRLDEIAKRKAEAKAGQAARIKIAIEQAPLCVVCKKPMPLNTKIGRDGEVGIPGSGRWSYTCDFKIKEILIPETRR
jgi:chromosome segregation ATPase